MGRRQFYLEWFKRTFHRSLLLAALISGVLAILGGLLSYFVPNLDRLVQVMLWSIPVVVFVGTVIVHFLRVPYSLYRNLEASMLSDKNRIRFKATLNRQLEQAEIIRELLRRQISNQERADSVLDWLKDTREALMKEDPERSDYFISEAELGTLQTLDTKLLSHFMDNHMNRLRDIIADL